MSLGKTIPHDSSLGHVTGKSVFVDDRMPLKNEVYVGVVGVPCSAGIIKKIITEDALKVSGVIATFTGKDFHHNLWGTIVCEQPILVDQNIGYYDEPACLVVATNIDSLKEAKKKIKFEIEKKNPVLSIDEAIKKDQYIYKAHPFKRGNPEEILKKSKNSLEGFFECGGQEHFYLENQTTIAYPLENGQMEIHSSSQHPTETQHVVAHSLGLPLNFVTCIVKRMGGGFGGKESQAAHFAAMPALVAHILKRPARLVLTKDEDMMMTGKRHPFKIFYKVGFDSLGVIESFIADLYADGGAYADLSSSILERAMFHIDGSYFLENVLINGSAVRTNFHSNTAFRGFGGPQGNMCIESIIEDIAVTLKKDALEIRNNNLYGIDKKNITPYGQLVDNNQLPKIFKNLTESSQYKNRVKEIKKFNLENTNKLRGISLTGCKFGIAFTAKFLNQGNALVNVHTDGTIQVSTGATEMGQGVNSKIRQIVSHAFSIDPSKVIVMATSTEKNHNTSPTAASSGADINGAAALKACEKIIERIKWVFWHECNGNISASKECPSFVEGKQDLSKIKLENGKVFDDNKSIEFEKIVTLAYFNRISLGDYAFFKTTGLDFDKSKGEGKAFNYFTNGAAVSEVEIDKYTGELKVLRADLLMDLGRSINPGIDEGQISGAYIQAMGWVTTEKLFYTTDGKLLSHSPTTYKIPSIQDTPRIFNINLLENNTNAQNVHRSKAVGEPPFLLGTSVWTAIKNALSYETNGKIVNLKSPATAEEILMKL